MTIQSLKRAVLGQPLPTSHEVHERLGRATGLAVFASDALSSSAYATEEILLILALAGTTALHVGVPISIGIAVLIAIVVSSYRQTILAYPSAGGAYIVSRENLGTYPSLVAGSALLTDYVLTVSVSVAAGIAAVTSAVPALYPYRVELCVLGVLAITVANLRGVRESGRLFAVPTYAFIGAYTLMILWGLAVWAKGDLGGPPAGAGTASEPVAAVTTLSLFLVLRAFASGCVALTGIEAVSNGVPAFRPPEARNARQVLVLLGTVLIGLFVGITFLANGFGLTPDPQETINSQLARRVFGGGSVLYYLVQALTTLILIIAANTSFADFPRLSSFMARDRFMPRQFASRGDRLAFSNGIIILAVLSAVLLVVFRADTHALIPLYAIGVFVSLNATGAVTTGVVALVIAATKFTHGAWIVILLIPLIVLLLVTIRRHYDDVAGQLSLDGLEPEEPAPGRHHVLVPIGDVHRGVVSAIRYARAMSPDARAVYIEIEAESRRRVEARWAQWANGMPLVVLRSPYRSVMGPLLEYVDGLQRESPDTIITIVLPEFVPVRWWQQLLHNQTALLIKGAMLFRRGVIVIDVPYHLAARGQAPGGPIHRPGTAPGARETPASPSARLQA
jgi:amino acid transporter